MKYWIQAFRLRTLPLAVASISMAGFLAASHDNFKLNIVLFCLLTTVLLQILSNLANDYGDSIHGADNLLRKGPERAVQSGKLSRKSMKFAIFIASVLSLASGLYLLHIARLESSVYLTFIVLGLAAICAAILYTNGKIPYGYKGLGDISVFIFFGMIAILGCYYLQSKQIEWELLLPGFSVGFFTVAVLNVNNIRDIESDILAGKKSIPVRLGLEKARQYHYFLLIAGLLSACIYVMLNYRNPLQFSFLVVMPLLYMNALAIKNKTAASELDPYLKQMALTTLLFVFIFGFSIIMF